MEFMLAASAAAADGSHQHELLTSLSDPEEKNPLLHSRLGVAKAPQTCSDESN